MNRKQRRNMARVAKKDNQANYKRMMRTQMLNNAAESLSAKELEDVMENTKILRFVQTELDENGVPVDGETKEIKLSNIDIKRLEGVLANKRANEQRYLETHSK